MFPDEKTKMKVIFFKSFYYIPLILSADTAEKRETH